MSAAITDRTAKDALNLAREILERPQAFALITVQGVLVLAQAVVDLSADLEDSLNFSDDMGCASRAEVVAKLKASIGEILLNAVGGKWPRYETPDGFTKWGLVQEDINAVIDRDGK